MTKPATKAAIEATQAKGERTRQAILDAAESLFGETDYDSITMRDVAQHSGALLGVVSYHFKNKKALFEAVVARRAQELNSILAEELARQRELTLQATIEAFVRPVLKRSTLPGWRSYIRIMAQLYYQDRWWPMQRDLFQDPTDRFTAALKRALPNARASSILGLYNFVVMFTLSTSVLKSSSEEAARLPIEDQALVAFLVGGAQALAEI